MQKNTLGQELVKAVKEALESENSGKIVRPKIDVAAIRHKLGPKLIKNILNPDKKPGG